MTCSFVQKGDKVTLVTATHIVICEVVSVRGRELNIDTQVEVVRSA